MSAKVMFSHLNDMFKGMGGNDIQEAGLCPGEGLRLGGVSVTGDRTVRPHVGITHPTGMHF